MERAYRNLGLALLALPPIFVAGFWIPYLSDIPQFDPSITAAVHVHALLLFAWIGLLVIQPLAIRRGAFSIHRHQVAAHMRYMICIALVLLPAGLARTLGYWFGVEQSLSQTCCLVLIDLCLIALIWFDRTRRLPGRPYIAALALYVVIEVAWFALGRPI